MSMQPFVYNSQASRVVFGVGSLSYLTREIEALGARRALVLSTPEQRRSAEQVAELIGEHCAGIFDRAVMHVPIETAREATLHGSCTQIARSLLAAVRPPVLGRQSRWNRRCPFWPSPPPMQAAK